MEIVLMISNVVLIGVVLFLRDYLKKKSENLATKEDIGEITKQVEAIKAATGAQLYIHQVRYQNEFKILQDLAEKIVDLKNATLALRPAIDSYDLKEPEEDRKRKRLKPFYEALEAFYKLYEPRKPFYPEKIYDSLAKLNLVMRKEAIEYAHTSDQERNVDRQYWQKADQNAAKISELTDEIMNLVRERIKYWEDFNSKN